MPGLSWASLRVVAADGLSGRRGVGLRSPILQDDQGRRLVPASVDDETVTPRQLLGEVEVEALFDAGTWVRLRPLPAKRGHVVVVRSESFKTTCLKVRLRDDLVWEDPHEGVEIAYVERGAAHAWRERCAARFVDWADKRLAESPNPAGIAQLRPVLEQALFVADRGSPLRERVFVLFGVVLAKIDPPAWPRLADVLLSESPGLTLERLDGMVDDARRTALQPRGGRLRSKSWATASRQPLQPPAL
jgi:hypothetical protein